MIQGKRWLLGQYIKTLAIRDGSSDVPHIDLGDGRKAMTVLIALGNFTGGHLKFPQLGIEIPIQAGDIVIFRASCLVHYVEDAKGKRYALTGIIGKNLFTWANL